MLLSYVWGQEILWDQGLERSYHIHLPESYSANSHAMPLVIVLHGRGQTGQSMQSLSDFNALADDYQFIVVYPDGLDNQWNYVRDIPGYPEGIDDTTFLLNLIDHIAQTYPVDRDRLYVSGFSNGGFMTQRLACDVPEVFAAFASVSAAGFAGMPDICNHNLPVSILLMHGTHDAIVPWNGYSRRNDAGIDVLILADVPRSFAFWAKHSGCSDETEQRSYPQSSPETSVTQIRVLECPEKTETLLYIIHRGGHNWPGSTALPVEIAGAVSKDISASEEIWQFFSQHQR